MINYKAFVYFWSWYKSTFIFISFAIETISSALHFSSLVLLSSMQTFLLARVQHFQPLSQSKFIPSEHWEVDLMKNQDRLFRIISLKTSLRSKRFRLVSEQKKTEERDSRFWPHEKWKKI